MDELEDSVAEILNTSAEADRPVNSSDKGGFPEPGGDIVRVSMEIGASAYMKDGKNNLQTHRRPHHPNDAINR